MYILPDYKYVETPVRCWVHCQVTDEGVAFSVRVATTWSSGTSSRMAWVAASTPTTRWGLAWMTRRARRAATVVQRRLEYTGRQRDAWERQVASWTERAAEQ